MNDYRNVTAPAVAMSRSGLFSKVMTLLTGSFAIGGLGTIMGTGIHSTGTFILLAILFLVGAFAVPLLARVSTAAGVTALGIWMFISGLFTGPVIGHYVAVLGTGTVTAAYLGTGAVMAICAVFGAAMSYRTYTKLSGIAFLALLVLIVIGFIKIFVAFSTGATILFSLAGMAVFSIYFLVDFFLVAHEEDSWPMAILLTMNLYLDFLNFLLYLLQFLAAILGKDD